MKHPYSAIFFAIFFVIMFYGLNMDKISSGNGDLAIKLYKSLIAEDALFEGENLFFSPLSISTSLAMTLLGARNTTAAQMKEVLGFRDLSDDLIHSGFSKLVEKLFSDPEEACSLKLANRLFGEKKCIFYTEFVESNKKYYESALQTVDFRGNLEATRIAINEWVEEKTENKIQDLLPEGSDAINSASVLVIVNAIYFKGRWANRFKSEATQIEPFFVTEDLKRQVEMMHTSAEFGYYEDVKLKSKVLDLPYANSSLHMVIVLPNEIGGLRALEDSLEIEVFNRWMSALEMSSATVTVSLPKFNSKSNFSAKKILIGLGMTDLFSPIKADFRGMGHCGGRLYARNALHQAFIEVNEEGTEAAAATVVIINLKSASRIFFKADHSFLFFVWDSKTKAILFLGKYAKPPELDVTCSLNCDD